MYLYYDKNGTLKEIINDIPSRVGSSNWNKIYVHFEGFDDHTITSAWIKYYLPNSTYYYAGGTTEIVYNNHYVGATAQEVPYDKKRDLLFFEYFKKYEFYEFNVPDGVLALNGSVGATIGFVTASQVLTMGGTAFQVDGTSSFLPDENINVAQWNELKKLYSDTIGNYVLKSGSSDITGNISPATNNSVNLGASATRWNTIYTTNLDVLQDFTAQNSIITGNSTVGGNVSVGGNTEIDGEFVVNDIAEFNDAVTVTNNQLIVNGINVLNKINSKQDTLVAGANIQIAQDGKTISATDTTYSAGSGIAINNGVISNTKEAVWGSITGALSSQSDLNNELTDLQDQIDNLKAIGRYLSGWNCATGLATTNPPQSPYTYKTGDYFIVSSVGTTNYKPNGATYVIGQASSTVETNEVKVNDYYRYDGTTWHLEINTQRATTWGSIGGTLSNQPDLQNALNGKQNTLVSGTNIKTINNESLLGSGNISISSPTKTSDLQNDSGFIDNNVSDLMYYTTTSLLSAVATSGEYSDLYNKPTIPTVLPVQYMNTAPTQDNTGGGLIIVKLSAEPTTKYNGYIYLIEES